MKLTTRIAAAVVVAALFATPAFAQKGGMGLGLVGGYYSLSGDIGEDTDAGIGGEVSLRFRLKPTVELPLMFGYSSHGITDTDYSLSNMRISIEPRYLFATTGKMMPFLGVRLGWAQSSADVMGSSYKQDGWIYGATGGLQIPISTSLNFEGAVTYTGASFGNFSEDGTEIPDSDASGGILSLQLGIVFNFGKK